MTLLDRFRTQPRQKHADPAVRLAFVEETPLAERALLSTIAREDDDPRVRRAAVSKLLDAAALLTVAKEDGDETVRAAATGMLRDLALESFEGVGEEDGLAAVGALALLKDTRPLAVVAKSAPSVTVALRARAALDDPHLLGSIARHAEHETVRRDAFEVLVDAREILGVALNSEFREPALTAVDRFTARNELSQIASRAKNKSAAKRARALLREMDEREARARDEALAAAAAARAAAALNKAAAEPAAVIESEQPAGIALSEQSTDARPEAPQAEARFEPESGGARDLVDLEAERTRARLVELAEEAERVAGLDDLASAKRQFSVIRREWADLIGRGAVSAVVSADPGLTAVAEAPGITGDLGLPGVLDRYVAAQAKLSARDAASREDDQRRRREALTRLQQLAARMEPLAAHTDLPLKVAERAMRDLRAAMGSIPPLPSRADYEEITRRLKALQAALIPKLQELRDVAGWQRWANVGIQEQLCEKMEALKTVDDPELVARTVKELQQQWRSAADVPRAQGEALWKRFKAAHDEVWAKCEAHFAAQAAVRAENLQKKLELAARAEALADSTSWIQTAEAIKRLQAEWKTLGPVTRGHEKLVWDRFRTACDRFFTRRHADLGARKKAWAENASRKEALIIRAEALADSSDWEVAAAALKALQVEWRAVGPVKRSRSEALWLRFRAACDRFFTRYAHRHDIAKVERLNARQAIVGELEKLAAIQPADGTEEPAGLLGQIRDIRARWQQELAARGVERDQALALDERFAAAFAGVTARWPAAFAGSDLDADSNRRRMESLVARMEELATSVAGPASAEAPGAEQSPTTRLASMLKEALAANTIGGKVDNEQRLRAAQDEMRRAQSDWSRIGPVPDDLRRALTDRFQRAIRRIGDKAGAASRLVGARR